MAPSRQAPVRCRERPRRSPRGCDRCCPLRRAGPPAHLRAAAPGRVAPRGNHGPGTQCGAAVETTTSAGSSSSRSRTSWHHNCARSPSRSRASATMSADESSASTRRVERAPKALPWHGRCRSRRPALSRRGRCPRAAREPPKPTPALADRASNCVTMERDPRASRPHLTARQRQRRQAHPRQTPAAVAPARKQATTRSRGNAEAPTNTKTTHADDHTPRHRLHPPNPRHPLSRSVVSGLGRGARVDARPEARHTRQRSRTGVTKCSVRSVADE
jgi:hypothetical protein